MRIKIVSLDERGSHTKLHKNTRESILKAGHEVVESDYELIHYEEVVNLNDIRPVVHKISFVMIGFSWCLRNNQIDVFKMMVKEPLIHRIILITIHPGSLKRKIEQLLKKIPSKIRIIDESPCEDRAFYRLISQKEARDKLRIPGNSHMALYYGTYWYSRGADRLLEVALTCPDIDFYMVGDTKLYNSFDFDIKRYQADNIHWVDEWVSEETARDYFRAANIVMLPYRHYYEHDSSGVFNQSMLAERPVIVPKFSPFIDILNEYDVGHWFDEDTLKESIVTALWFEQLGGTPREYDKYLDRQRGWEMIGRSL